MADDSSPHEIARNGSVQIARTLRALRESRALSLRALAREAGVSSSLLSQIEMGRVKPSVDTLFALAEALAVPVARFFADSVEESAPAVPSDRLLIRHQERKRLTFENGNLWTLLTGEELPGFRFLEITYPPGSTSGKHMLRHRGRDFLVCIEGELTVQLGFSTDFLGPADSMWFDSHIPHQLRNETSMPTRFMSVTIDPWPIGAGEARESHGHAG